MGTPAAVYHGGLLHSTVRYFDPDRRRPGLPEHVAALVEEVRPDGTRLTLVNTDLLQERQVLVQAGGFGEHRFGQARVVDGDDAASQGAEDRYLLVRLGPGSEVRIDVEMVRFVNDPSYAFPLWERVARVE